MSYRTNKKIMRHPRILNIHGSEEQPSEETVGVVATCEAVSGSASFQCYVCTKQIFIAIYCFASEDSSA